MTDKTEARDAKLSWKFPREFWLANVMELLERAAYYGFFIVLTLYLTRIVGFSDTVTGVVGGIFFSGLYFLPPFVGALADRIGFKRGLMLAFSLLTVGYFFLGVFHSKAAVLAFLAVVMVGGSFIKPLITGTVAKTTTEATRARGYSLFYWIVNIGAFAERPWSHGFGRGSDSSTSTSFRQPWPSLPCSSSLFCSRRSSATTSASRSRM